MKKIKITDTQKKMLESAANAKLKLIESGIAPSNSPSRKVTNAFKKGNNIKGFKAEAAQTPISDDINWNELVINVHEFLKQLYTNPTKEGLNPYWESINVTWDELIQMLTAVDIIKSVKGGYRLTKIVGNPAKAVKIVAKLIEKLIKDKNMVPVEEIDKPEINADTFKKQIGSPIKTGKTRAELLAIIAAKRAESQKITADREAKRDADNSTSIVDEDNLPAGAKYDSSAPWNQPEPKQGIRPKTYPFNIKWYHQDIAIFEKDGKFYAYNVESADNSEYSDYADREEKFLGRDEDGMPDVEYGDWEIDENIISSYVNDNIEHLSFGKGLVDWENGVEMVEITSDLAQDLMSLANYIKGPVGEQLYNILSSINLEETTSTGSVGGSYVGKLSVSPITTQQSNVASEIKSSIDEINSNSGKSEILDSLRPFVEQSPDSLMLFWLSNEATLKQIVDKIQGLGDEEWMLIIQFIVNALQGAEMYIEQKDEGGIVKFKDSVASVSDFLNHFSSYIGEATTTTSVGGDSGTFAYDAPVGDGGSFWTVGNKMNKKSVKENNKAFKNTQWPNGKFVEIDKCAKIGHNDKTAINGGCSTGAVDNVVKTKSSNDSIVSDSSIYESVAKATGRTVKEVKNIIDKKINKSI